MATVSFKKGLLSALPATKSEGTFYVTTDERAIYLDVSATDRIRLGDFQEFANVAALEANQNPSTSALYYVNDINCLAKWDGSSYIQINKDTGMTSIDVTGTGNAITVATYDAAGRKLTLTKGATFATKAYVGDIPSGYTESTIVAYINKKAQEVLEAATGGSSESAASVKGQLDTYISTNNTRVGNVESDVSDLDGRVDALEGVGAQANVIETVKVNGTALPVTGKAVDVSVPGYTISKDTNSGDYAAVYHLMKDGTAQGVAINIPKDMVVSSGSVVTNPSGQAAGTYIELVLANAENDKLYIPVGSLIEYVTSGSKNTDAVVIAVDGSTHKVTATLTDGKIGLAKLDSDTQTKINKAHSHDNATVLNGITSAKVSNWDAAYTNNHTHTNKTVLDGISTDKVTAWDAAEQNAKDYTDTALTWGSF